MAKATVAELRRRLQKPKENEEPYAWYFARRISIYITYCLIRTSITADQVTFLMLLTGLAAAIAFGSRSYAWNLVGLALMHLWYVLDCVDGEVARYRGTSSVAGVFLDYISHDINHAVMWLGLIRGALRFRNLPTELVHYRGILLWVCVSGVLGQIFYDLGIKIAREVNGNTPVVINEPKQQRGIGLGRVLSILKSWIDFPNVMLIITIGVLLKLQVFLVVGVLSVWTLLSATSLYMRFKGLQKRVDHNRS